MMNYELFLTLATQHKLGTLSRDRYEMLKRATMRGNLNQEKFVAEWWKSYSKPKTLEDHYDNYKSWCWNHSTKPFDFISWKSAIKEELAHATT
jgi:hypothetical protein